MKTPHGSRSREFLMVILSGPIAIVVLLAAVLLINALMGCQETPGLEPGVPWMGSDLPKPSKFRYVGPGTWTVTDGHGGTTTMTTKE